MRNQRGESFEDPVIAERGALERRGERREGCDVCPAPCAAPAPRGARIAPLPARTAHTFTIHPLPPQAAEHDIVLDVQVCCACSPCQRHFSTSRVHVLHDPACRMA